MSPGDTNAPPSAARRLGESPRVAAGRRGPEVEPALGQRGLDPDTRQDLLHPYQALPVPVALDVDVVLVGQRRHPGGCTGPGTIIPTCLRTSRR